MTSCLNTSAGASKLQRQDLLAEFVVDDLRHPGVDGRGTAEQPDPSSHCMDNGTFGKITDTQQNKEERQRKENQLRRPVVLECANKHERGENAPEQEIETHALAIGFADVTKRIGHDGHEGPPEQAVSRECRSAERVVLPELHDSRDDLGGPAQTNAHGQNDGRHGNNAGIVQVEQQGGHPKAQQAERRGIGNSDINIVGWHGILQIGLK